MLRGMMNGRLMIAISILVLTAVLMASIIMDQILVGFFVGPIRFSHLMAWIGTLFVAFYVPIYHVLKRRSPKRVKMLLDIHNFGFLIAFLLISIHFAGQMSRPAQSFPDLGEGVALFTTMLLLVVTGMYQRFGPKPSGPKRRYNLTVNRVFHTSLVSAFYIIIAFHVLINLDLI